MALAPDYGLYLHERGGSDHPHSFDDVAFGELLVNGPGHYTIMADIEVDATAFAVALDFDAKILEKILGLAPAAVSETIVTSLDEDPVSPRSLTLPETVPLQITAKLGSQHQDQDDLF